MTPAKNLMASFSRSQSAAGLNGLARVAEKPISRSFMIASRPRATPKTSEATHLGFSGKRSSRPAPSNASSGTVTNVPTVSRPSSVGAVRTTRTSKHAKAVTA
jgi:hypothetical protein